MIHVLAVCGVILCVALTVALVVIIADAVRKTIKEKK